MNVEFNINDPEFRKQLLIQVMEVTSLNDARLVVLSDWLKSEKMPNPYNGHLENAIEQAKIDVRREIADVIEEVLTMDHDRLLEIAVAIKNDRR